VHTGSALVHTELAQLRTKSRAVYTDLQPVSLINLFGDRRRRTARIIIRGSAAVFRDDVQVAYPSVLRSLDGLVYDEERFTDYLGGPPEEDELAAALEPGGVIRFAYRDDGDVLTATTEYRTRRPLNDAELRLLVDYTMGQWSDGIGENWTCISPDKCGYSIMCLTAGDGVAHDYAAVQVVAD
jgi:hypothetical protein